MDPLARASSSLHRLAVPEDVGAVRRFVRALAVQMHASDADCGRVELAATELGTNTLNHARPPGYLLVQTLEPGGGLDIIAVDHGPGIDDVQAVLASERRTPGAPARGLGCGLASVRRLADDFDIHSEQGRGTVVLARMRFASTPKEQPQLRWGAVSLPLLGEVENGDAFCVMPQANGCAAMVVDGLGHGPGAARASNAAVALFERERELDIERYLAAAHEALRSTRGAAIALCRIFVEQQRALFAGIGNVEGRVHLRAGSTGLAPRNGTVGMHLAPSKAHVRELAWEPGATLVLHSDGIRHHFDFAQVRAIRERDPTLLAALLHRDLGRPRDDATVVVVQDTRAAP